MKRQGLTMPKVAYRNHAGTRGTVARDYHRKKKARRKMAAKSRAKNRRK